MIRCGSCHVPGDIDLSSGRCTSEACTSVFSWAERSRAQMKTPDGWFCYGCVLGKYPRLLDVKVRKEQFVLAELQRRLPDILALAMTIVWDCLVPGGCSLKRPDLLLKFVDRYLHFEVDEWGHPCRTCIDEDQRLAIIAADVDLPGLVVRLNPDVPKHRCFESVMLTSGDGALQAVKVPFSLLMDRTESVVRKYMESPRPDTASIVFIDSHPEHSEVTLERPW